MTIWCFSFELFWKSNCVLYSVWTDYRVGRLTTDHRKHTKEPNSHKWGNLCLYYIPLWQMPPQGKKHQPSNSGKGKTAVNDGFWLPGIQALMSRFSLFRFHFFYFTVSFLLWAPGFSSGCQVCTANTFSPLNHLTSRQFAFLRQFPNWVLFFLNQKFLILCWNWYKEEFSYLLIYYSVCVYVHAHIIFT